MTALSKTAYEAFLKEWYVGTRVADLVYKNHPYLGLVPKKPNVRGTNYRKPVRYANIAGQSSSFAKAHANQAPAKREDWVVTHSDNYAKASVENKVIELALDSAGSFRPALQDAVDSAHSAFANDLHWELINSDTTGARGTVTGAPVGLVLTLGPGEARFFEPGMVLQHSDDAGATIEVAGSGEEATVESVDVGNNTITLAADFAGTGVADGDILYRSGDYTAGRAAGLKAWLPGSGVGTAPFFSVVRTLFPSRLAGVDGVTGTATDIELTDSLIRTAAAVQNEGGSPECALLASADFARLARETEQRGRYAKVDSTSGNISFSSLQIMTGSGAVDCVSDPGVASPGAYFLLDLSTIELFSAGGLPRMFDKDGNFYHRTESLDELSFYLFGFYNQVIQHPGSCSYVTTAY